MRNKLAVDPDSGEETEVDPNSAEATTEEEDILKKIDDGFAFLVGGLYKVLFHSVFQSEQEYFEYESSDASQTDKNGIWIFSEEDQLFHKQEKLRELLSSTETMTRDEARSAAEAGNLKEITAPDGMKVFISQRYVGGAPLVVLWLALGSLVFTFYMGFFNFWGFKHALEVIRGKYDNPAEAGEVTHFQALASALSATVGLGNIAGVTIAMTLGGPGAFFWMICCGFFGMSSKFVECTLGQKYRTVKPDGTVLGGPMRYLDVGLTEAGLRPLGLVLSVVFTIMCILASFGGGNMFQANQSGTVLLEQLQQDDKSTLKKISADLEAAQTAGDETLIASLSQEKETLEGEIAYFDKAFRVFYGLILAAFVALVIIGGIKRIGATAEKIVPSMCAIYIFVCLYIILMHIHQVP
ncbi:MAG: alanine:cation symporter family protein, partial [Planctomycetaceae bacterium]